MLDFKLLMDKCQFKLTKALTIAKGCNSLQSELSSIMEHWASANGETVAYNENQLNQTADRCYARDKEEQEDEATQTSCRKFRLPADWRNGKCTIRLHFRRSRKKRKLPSRLSQRRFRKWLSGKYEPSETYEE
jgi:hypothetical protein